MIINELIDELGINEEQKTILIDQINRFNLLKKQNINNGLIINDEGKVFLPEGTLIHGTRNNPDFSRIEGISKTGIVTGQAVGIAEDGETFYCADFFRVQSDISMEEYQKQFSDSMGFTPFDRGGGSIAFIIQPHKELNELLSYDCYRSGTNESQITRTFVNEKGLPRTGEQQATVGSILYGVPSNGISGIVVGDALLQKQEMIDYLIKLFPWCYITSKTGDVIYDHSKVNISNDELTEERRKKCSLAAKVEDLIEELKREKEEVISERNKYDSLFNALLKVCSSEQVAEVLIANGWQGDFESTKNYVERQKNNLVGKDGTVKVSSQQL